MSETTLQRADDRLREQLAEDPPIGLKLLDGDVVLGTLITTETRTGNDGGEFEVAVLGDANLGDMADPPDEFDEDQLVSLSISGASIKRQWDRLQPKPGERIGVRRIYKTKTSKGQDTVIYNLRVDRVEGDGASQ
jgi:hypothetical protein